MPVAVLDDSDERFQLGDSSEGSMAQLNPTSDTDTTAAIDSGAETSKINPQTPPLRGALPTDATPRTRLSFDSLCTLFVCGVLQYEFVTLTGQ